MNIEFNFSLMQIGLKCNCWKVQGHTSNIDMKIWNRIICHCGDCQTFANYLGKEDAILDEYQGTDIFQMPLSDIHIDEGKEHIKAIHMRPKGLHRWYAGCCNTPIGNTMKPWMNFMWVIHNFMDDEWTRDENLGPVRGYAFLNAASNTSRKATPLIKMLPRMFLKMWSWKWRGRWKTTDFFDSDWTPISEPLILSEK